MRVALRFALGLTAVLGLTQPALASGERAASTPSTTLAGYLFNYYIAVPGAVSAVAVVPKLNCKGTPPAGLSIYAGVGIQSVNSYARLLIACTPQGVARYYPSLVVNGTIKNIASDQARAGDTIEFAVSQSASQDTESVIDLTHKFVATRNGTGSGTGEGIAVGDFPVVAGSTTLGVPNFGTLAFSQAVVNGLPIGLAPNQLQSYNLAASSTGPVQIKTNLSSDKEAVTTVFSHA